MKNVSVKERWWVPTDSNSSDISLMEQSPKGGKGTKTPTKFSRMKCLPQGVITIQMTCAVLLFSPSLENASYPSYLISLSCQFSAQTPTYCFFYPQRVWL